jgi:hypothetical protein
MMMTLPPEVLLSDQFAEFSGKVTALHEKKKELVTEFKKAYEKHKADVKAIDDEASELQKNFNAWTQEGAAPKEPPKTKGK